MAATQRQRDLRRQQAGLQATIQLAQARGSAFLIVSGEGEEPLYISVPSIIPFHNASEHTTVLVHIAFGQSSRPIFRAMSPYVEIDITSYPRMSMIILRENFEGEHNWVHAVAQVNNPLRDRTNDEGQAGAHTDKDGDHVMQAAENSRPKFESESGHEKDVTSDKRIQLQTRERSNGEDTLSEHGETSRDVNIALKNENKENNSNRNKKNIDSGSDERSEPPGYEPGNFGRDFFSANREQQESGSGLSALPVPPNGASAEQVSRDQNPNPILGGTYWDPRLSFFPPMYSVSGGDEAVIWNSPEAVSAGGKVVDETRGSMSDRRFREYCLRFTDEDCASFEELLEEEEEFRLMFALDANYNATAQVEACAQRAKFCKRKMVREVQRHIRRAPVSRFRRIPSRRFQVLIYHAARHICLFIHYNDTYQHFQALRLTQGHRLLPQELQQRWKVAKKAYNVIIDHHKLCLNERAHRRRKLIEILQEALPRAIASPGFQQILMSNRK